MPRLWIMLLAGAIIVLGLVATVWVRTTGGLLPGYSPTRGNLDLFWATFWASLLAGLLISVAGAFVVGLGVWWFQRRWEEARDHSSALRDLAIFKERIRFQLDRPTHYSYRPGSIILSFIPDALPRLSESFQNEPIARWKTLLTDQADFFQLVESFQGAYSRCVVTWEGLEVRVASVVWATQLSKKHNMVTGACAALSLFELKLPNLDWKNQVDRGIQYCLGSLLDLEWLLVSIFGFSRMEAVQYRFLFADHLASIDTAAVKNTKERWEELNRAARELKVAVGGFVPKGPSPPEQLS